MNYKKYIKYFNKLQYGGKYSINDNPLNTVYCVENKEGYFETDTECNIASMWKHSYIDLYNYILELCDRDTNSGDALKIESVLTLLFQNLDKIDEIKSKISNEYKQIVTYNMRFIISLLCIMCDQNELLKSSNIMTIVNKYNINKPLDGPNFYFMEEIYQVDTDKFFEEYDSLIKNKTSTLFYRSNLVNIVIFLKCINDKCIEKITTNNKYYNKVKEIYTLDDLVHLYKTFGYMHKMLIKHILLAYKDFSYEKIKEFYKKYILFYMEAFPKMKKLVSGENIFDVYQNVDKIIDGSGNDYYIYLSCILPSHNKFIKFEATKILISYVGSRINEDDFYNSLDMVYHDFGNIHFQYGRKISYDQNELNVLQDFFRNIYKSFNGDELFKILQCIHETNYEDAMDSSKFTIESISKKMINLCKIREKIRFMDLKNILQPYIQEYIDNNISDQNKINTLQKIRNHIFSLVYINYVEQNRDLLIECFENTSLKNDAELFNYICDYLQPTNIRESILLINELTPVEIKIYSRVIEKNEYFNIIHKFIKFVVNKYGDNSNNLVKNFARLSNAN